VIDEIAAFAPECVIIKTGGEPFCAATSSRSSATASPKVCGLSAGRTASRFTENLAQILKAKGVRGMVTRAVESWCEKNGVAVVTATALEEIRARMPTPKVFGAGAGGVPSGEG